MDNGDQEDSFKKRKIDKEGQVDDSDTLLRETKIENINTKWINSAIIYWKEEKRKYYALKVVDHFFDFTEFCMNIIITNPAVNNDLVISFFIKDAAQEFIRSDEYGADNVELFDIVERLHPILNYYKHKSVCEFLENEKIKYESLQIISNEFDFYDFSSNLIKRNPLMHNEIIVSEFIVSTYEEMVSSGEYDLSNTAFIDFFRDLKELYHDYVLKGNS